MTVRLTATCAAVARPACRTSVLSYASTSTRPDLPLSRVAACPVGDSGRVFERVDWLRLGLGSVALNYF
jgi:hypothetical protein